MAGFIVRVGTELAGWADALDNLSTNSLSARWMQADARAPRRLSRLLPLLLGLGVAALLVWALLTGAWDPGDLQEYPLLITAVLGLVPALGWLIVRIYALGLFALGFLSRDERRPTHGVDDMVAVSPLSDQTLLVAGVAHALRLILPPLLLTNALLVAAFGALLYYARLEGAFQVTGAGDVSLFSDYLLLAPWLHFKLMLSGVLAALCVTLLLVCLSLTRRSGVLPALGAAALTLAQLTLIGASGVLAQHWTWHPVTTEMLAKYGPRPAVLLAAHFLLVVVLLLIPARWVGWLRSALAVGWPLLIPGAVLVLFLPDVDSLVWTAAGLGLINLTLLDPPHWLSQGSFGFFFGDAGDYAFVQPWRSVLLLVFQALLLGVCATFARDAVRRRRGGA